MKFSQSGFILILICCLLSYSAGCITIGDPIIGTWKSVSPDPTISTLLNMDFNIEFTCNSDNTVVIRESSRINKDKYSTSGTGFWKKVDDRTYDIDCVLYKESGDVSGREVFRVMLLDQNKAVLTGTDLIFIKSQ